MIINEIGIIAIFGFCLYFAFILGRFYNAFQDNYLSTMHHHEFKLYVKRMYQINGLEKDIHFLDEVDAELEKRWTQPLLK